MAIPCDIIRIPWHNPYEYGRATPLLSLRGGRMLDVAIPCDIIRILLAQFIRIWQGNSTLCLCEKCEGKIRFIGYLPLRLLRSCSSIYASEVVETLSIPLTQIFSCRILKSMIPSKFQRAIPCDIIRISSAQPIRK